MKKIVLITGWLFAVTLLGAGCISVNGQETAKPVSQRPQIIVPSSRTDDLTQIPISSSRIKTGSNAGSFALIRVPPCTTELKGSNEVRIRNPNNFPVLVMIRCEEKGLHLEIPAKSKTLAYLPNGGFQVSYIFANVPNAVMRGDHIHLPVINRINIDIPVKANDQP